MTDFICVHPTMRMVSKESNRITGITRSILRCSRCKYRVAEMSWWEGMGTRTVPKMVRTVVSSQNGTIHDSPIEIPPDNEKKPA